VNHSKINRSAHPPFVREEVYLRYLQGLLTNNWKQCRSCFELWLESEPDLRCLYEDLVRRSLYQVGELWEQGKISVATEHLATAISESMLNLTYPRLFSHVPSGKSALVTCAFNEHHQIGGKMVADMFELHGWRGYFLGANTPLDKVEAFIVEKRPNVLAFSLATIMNLDPLLRAAAEIRAAFPELPILVGGQAFLWGGREQVERLPGLVYIDDLGAVEAWIQNQGD